MFCFVFRHLVKGVVSIFPLTADAINLKKKATERKRGFINILFISIVTIKQPFSLQYLLHACQVCLFDKQRMTFVKKLEMFSNNSILPPLSCFLQFSSVQFSPSSRPHEPQHARPPCPSPTPAVHPNSSPLSRWCHPTISFSVIPFSSCTQSFPASGSFPMSQLFAWGGQSTGVSASASVWKVVAEQ